jgi:hypothetical protein
MRTHLLLITILASSLSAGSGCVQTECGEGTVERDGVCVTDGNDYKVPTCGPFTQLQGDRCVPVYQPTMCDPSSSEAQIDPDTGVVTCIGTGTSQTLACPQPVGATKLTICGQLYDIESGAKFAAPDAECSKCDPTAPTTSGPCALAILAFDALKYGADQTMGNITPGATDIYIDDCGRYRVSNIETNGTGPFIGLGFTEAGKLPQRPLDQLTVTATTGVATSKPSTRVVDKFEAWIVKPSTIMQWQNSGGPPLANGIYVGLFRAHKVGNGDQFAPQAGVTFTKNNNLIPSQDYYFTATSTISTVDPSVGATATSINGAGLLTGTSVADATAYKGQGGLGPHCAWEPHAAANLTNIVFFQIFRKSDVQFDPIPCAD